MRPEFGWLIAALGAGAAAWGLLTGEIPMRWGRVYRRDKSPRVFWISIVSLGILSALGVWIALTPVPS